MDPAVVRRTMSGLGFRALAIGDERLNQPGVLVLSRFAGTAEQMRDVLIVNHLDKFEVATAISAVLPMPKDERI